MKNTMLRGCFLVGALAVVVGSTACASRERVVVRERPAVVVERPVVRETVVVH